MSSSLKSKFELWSIGGFSSFLAELKKKKAPGFTWVKKAKSSLALNGNFPLFAFPLPKTFSPTLKTCSASIYVFELIGALVCWSYSTVKPLDLVSSIKVLILSVITSFNPFSKERMLPSMYALSEITLNLSPAWKIGNVDTKASCLYCFS